MTMNKTFYANFIDAGWCEINPHPVEISATSLGHALQKAAGQIPEDAVKVEVWEYIKDRK